MRGKAPFITLNDFNGRITPAHAGKRRVYSRFSIPAKDHPRPCGEKIVRHLTVKERLGSPPPMRGKDDILCSRRRHTGITPRPCGEKAPRRRLKVLSAGSPPPMRGKVRPIGRAFGLMRITPAHAGKRKRSRTAAGRHQDHPRPCGEKWQRLWHWRPRAGSPPPMRGKANCPSRSASAKGITPAHAGKRHQIHKQIDQRQDHPRPCGEKLKLLTYASDMLGSPPPMRGKGAPASTMTKIGRITPAHAGKSA